MITRTIFEKRADGQGWKMLKTYITNNAFEKYMNTLPTENNRYRVEVFGNSYPVVFTKYGWELEGAL